VWRKTLLASLFLLAGCTFGSGTQTLNDAGPLPDGGPLVDGGPLDCGAGPSVTLSVLADLCAEVSAGQHHLDRAKSLEETQCGVALSADDLPHLASSPLLPAPSCATGALAMNMHRFEGSIAKGRMAYDPAMAAQCRTIGEASDGGSPIYPDGGYVEACAQALTGLVALGGACDYHEECASGYCAPGSVATCSGACAPPLAIGVLCEPRRDICGSSASCGSDGNGAYRCEPKSPSSEAKGLGEACGDHEPCAGPCLKCDLAQGFCVALGHDGDPCGSDGDCLNALFCSADTCRMRPRTGEACVAGGVHGNCLYGDDACDNGTCIRLAPICAPPPESSSGPKQPGDACGSDSECQSGLCDHNARVCKVPCGDGCIGNFLSYYGYLLFFGLVMKSRGRVAKP
jgi:hypothetical protein